MAGQWGHHQEQHLLQSANAVTDMLSQLQNAAMSNSSPSRGAHFRGRRRGVRYPDVSLTFGETLIIILQRREGIPGHYNNSWGQQRQRCYTGRWQQQGRYEDTPQHDAYRGATRVTPEGLVECLAKSPSFSASLLQLMEEKSYQPSSVRELVSSWNKIFYLNDEVVELKPQIKFCTAHSGTQGCQRRSSCSDLHLCPNYVLTKCHEQNCVLGHKWMTDHNISVLKPLFLDHLIIPTLRRIIQSVSPCDIKQLEVCRDYNEGDCDQSDCEALHVCLSFVLGLTKCSHIDCQLNHNLLSPDCCQLLKTHGLPTNESPRDIVVALLSTNPNLSQDEQSSTEDKDSSNMCFKRQVSEMVTKGVPTKTKNLIEKNKKNTKKKASKPSRNFIHKNSKQCSSEGDSSSKTEDESESDSDSKSDSSLSDEKSSSEKFIKKSKSLKLNTDTPQDKISGQDKPSDHAETLPVKREIRRTLWSHYLQGDVPIPEICYYSVEEMCKYEGSGCHRLHSTQHFHWQVSEQGNRWLNLRPSQVTCLERAYCDPSQDGVDLPRLDPATLEISVGGLLILMGRDTWHANLKAMNLTNSSKTKILNIRRLCTQAISDQVIKPAIFTWYFLDVNKKWVKYGNADTAGKNYLVSSVTADDIEKHFQQTPSVPLSFMNSRFIYILDFNTLIQTNQSTNVSREVRRRPEPHLPDEKTDKGRDQKTDDFPSCWEVMQPEERVRLVALAPTSSEYQTVVGLLARRVQSSKVLKVERIQNPFLWRALQNKIKEMTTVYGDESKVNVRQLFHGTGQNVVSSICAENFDWRLHGSSSGQSFGQGTYFSTDAAYSYKYCRPDNTGMRYMFVARTAVGTSTVGNSSMVRPPANRATNLPFDSTVNNQANPTIIVKYDKQEYYPEYILTLT
nr:protein mono-ADP-ribosyltransferase PARP12-like isoform X2 [Procambarus clarkii]XP_045581066.1 protein mono-ADP-ribosyltransferase PARP12-like isoform X2 [Procambarus clarkii]XP_045581067.1 protein mono-ADP-ribosyltransferase PARP12-like isoform X2 [Procambarus clarkii]